MIAALSRECVSSHQAADNVAPTGWELSQNGQINSVNGSASHQTSSERVFLMPTRPAAVHVCTYSQDKVYLYFKSLPRSKTRWNQKGWPSESFDLSAQLLTELLNFVSVRHSGSEMTSAVYFSAHSWGIPRSQSSWASYLSKQNCTYISTKPQKHFQSSTQLSTKGNAWHVDKERGGWWSDEGIIPKYVSSNLKKQKQKKPPKQINS